MLTGAQRASYDRDGFIVVPDVFSAEDIAELRRVTDEFVSASATVTVNDSIYDLEDTHSADEPRVRRLKAPHAIHPAYMRASRNPKIILITHYPQPI
jgi:ectoine hydroxylase-related dioxygenase (phytanoyl-CoA dioxygenase family)